MPPELGAWGAAQEGRLVEAMDSHSGEAVRIAPPPGLPQALAELGLDRAVGSLRLLQLDPPQARPPVHGQQARQRRLPRDSPAWSKDIFRPSLL